MTTGMLKFSPNNTVYIDLDLENHTANKAVDIDAEGVEWPLCGGSGDYKIFKATLTSITTVDLKEVKFTFNDMLYKLPDIPAEETIVVWLPVIGDETSITNANFSNITGNAALDLEAAEPTLVVTGDFAANIAGLIA